MSPVTVLAVGDDLPPDLAGDKRFRVTMIDPFGPRDELPAELVADAEVLMSDAAPANIAAMTKLRWLQLGSAGYQQLAGHRLAARDVVVTNASGVNDIPIAEWSVLMMMALERDLLTLLGDVAARRYRRPARYQSELRGRRVGIIGYGGIGRELARQAKALGLEVWAMNRSPIGPAPQRFTPTGTGDPDGVLPDRTFPKGDWEAFLPGLDYLVLTVALNAATSGLIGLGELALLPPHAHLLNPARAALVDETALRQALASGALAGAALDSHYREPMPPDDPTWALPRTIVTPHISGSTASPQYRPRMWELFTANLHRFVAGSPLLNVVPPGDLPD
ncbi:NAD(P)-dependent oxidoreductase [Nakamurella lactea]|uniref:NAD(P)-dependent oxidoreductase n=1 Tax=Nakamurella lactea TaxID=459515 RepID=UPI00040D1008|nr:NAD(P)-dependent oxidoreductase [Nakamurella lactea]